MGLAKHSHRNPVHVVYGLFNVGILGVLDVEDRANSMPRKSTRDLAIWGYKMALVLVELMVSVWFDSKALYDFMGVCIVFI